MHRFFALIILLCGFAAASFAGERVMLVRVTGYWRGGGEPGMAATGPKLTDRHCAIDPAKIPYGSTIIFPDATLTAVDTGPAIVSRKAARRIGRTPPERNALVIDRFFSSQAAAVQWTRAHPAFITVRVLTPGAIAAATQVGGQFEPGAKSVCAAALFPIE